MKKIARLQEAILKDLWPKIPPERRALLEQQAAVGHQHLLDIRNGMGGDRTPPVAREVLLLHSLLHDDPDNLLRDAIAPKASLTQVRSDGQIYYGGVAYDSTDPWWLYCLWAWEETGPTNPFQDAPVVLQIPDTTTLAILGDWGGNNTPAQQVATAVRSLSPQYYVHLGDVYYAGTDKKGVIESDYQSENFLDVWPGAAGKSFNLNSNHDMYAHATGYYGTALASSLFSAQAGCSYFALFNSGFRFIGLDTAYFDPNQSGSGFMNGALNPTQEKFLHNQAVAAVQAGQELVLFSHHNGLSIDGQGTTPLWDQVIAQLAPLAGKRVIWYWGHEHLAAVYAPQKVGDVTVLSRCCGHGCIPWGFATALRDSKQVLWFEQQILGPGSNYFVTNGFATLKVDGASIMESFFGQDGSSHWRSSSLVNQ